MNMYLKTLSLVFFLFVFKFSSVAQQSKAAYKKEIASWDSERLSFLKSATGWVNLAGLFWLKPGENTFGAGPSNDIIFTHPEFPSLLGTFNVQPKEITWKTNGGNDVYIKGKKIDLQTVFHVDSISAPSLSFKTFKWNIIKREDKVGIRFRDLNNPALQALTHINRFDVDPKWKVKAVLETALFSTIAITNLLGQTSDQQSPGKLVFTIEGKTYKLDVLDEGPGDLYVIFGDETNGTETYHTGRFLYVPRPDENGNTLIDFNKSHNPPCAFTPFATCPIPPRQNMLALSVFAGEKNVH
jgi:uncharacterized protein (DUF1684 family)